MTPGGSYLKNPSRWVPRVLLSRGLFDALSAEERAVILAHERAHVRRRDALVGSVARAVAVFHLPWVGRWLVHEQRAPVRG